MILLLYKILTCWLNLPLKSLLFWTITDFWIDVFISYLHFKFCFCFCFDVYIIFLIYKKKKNNLIEHKLKNNLSELNLMERTFGFKIWENKWTKAFIGNMLAIWNSEVKELKLFCKKNKKTICTKVQDCTNSRFWSPIWSHSIKTYNAHRKLSHPTSEASNTWTSHIDFQQVQIYHF